MYKLIVWIILQKDNKVLLLKKTNINEHTFAGGHVEDNESLKSAAVRLVEQETNFKLNYENLDFVCVIDREMDIGYKAHIFFKATEWQNKLVNNEPNIHSEIEWYDLNNLPSTIGVLASMAVDSLKTGKPYHFNDDFQIHNKH